MHYGFFKECLEMTLRGYPSRVEGRHGLFAQRRLPKARPSGAPEFQSQIANVVVPAGDLDEPSAAEQPALARLGGAQVQAPPAPPLTRLAIPGWSAAWRAVRPR